MRFSGSTVRGAATGEKALTFCTDAHQDVVLADIDLGPGMNGLELTQQLRALPNPPRVLVVAAGEHTSESLAAGAAGFFGKPINWDRVIATIHEERRRE